MTRTHLLFLLFILLSGSTLRVGTYTGWSPFDCGWVGGSTGVGIALFLERRLKK